MFALTLGGCLFLSDGQLEAALDADGDGHRAQDVGGDDCDDSRGAVTGPETRWGDGDGDGYGDPDSAFLTCDDTGVTNGDDCDDADPETGVDRAWYTDADHDGLGAGEVALRSCPDPGEGYSLTDDDCDDSDATILLDRPWYTDDDGDGFGAGEVALETCADPGPGYSTNDDDCDDDDADVNPGALEGGYDDKDYDCDGQKRDGILEVVGMALGASVSGTGAGVAAAALPDDDGLDDVAVGLPGHGDGGGVFIVEGVSDWGNPKDLHFRDTLEAPTWWETGEADAEAGSALVATDLDGDGESDLVVGAPGASAVSVLYGPFPVGEIGPDATLVGDDELGATLAAGRVGTEPVFLVGGGSLAYVIPGAAVANGSIDLSALTWLHVAAGGPVAMGDADGDGTDEAVFGDASGAGSARVCAGDTLSGELYAWECPGLLGHTSGDALGTSVLLADLDGDGHGDLVAGAPGVDGSGAEADLGAVYIVRGGLDADRDAEDADRRILGESATEGSGGRAGSAVTVPGAHDSGATVLAVGADGYADPRNRDEAGAVYWLIDPLGGTVDALADADERAVGTWGDPAPAAAGCNAGRALWPGLDFDGDDLADTLVGAPGWFYDGHDPNGAITVVSGRWVE